MRRDANGAPTKTERRAKEEVRSRSKDFNAEEGGGRGEGEKIFGWHVGGIESAGQARGSKRRSP